MDFDVLDKAKKAALTIDHPSARIIKFLEVLGVQVLFQYKSAYGFLSECSYNQKTIKISNLSEAETLLTLLHEAGHYLSHLRLGHGGLQSTTFEREFWAYQHGWLVARWLRIELKRDVWNDFHKMELNAYEAFLGRKNEQKSG